MAKKKRIKDQGTKKQSTQGAFGDPNFKNRREEDEELFDIQESYGKAEDFITKNKTAIFGLLGLLLVGILGFYIWKNFIVPPKEKNAQIDLYEAQNYFEKDSFNLALNGDGNYPGFLDVISDYGSSKAGNLAKYYAGACYLNMGDYEAAIDYYQQFKSKDMIVSSMALGGIGDANMQLGNTVEGISYYEKAANNSDNHVTAPMYHFRAGLAKEQNGDVDGARKHYEIIKNEYPESTEGRDVEKYLARVGS